MNDSHQTRSVWMDYEIPERPALEASGTCDVCVIGAGIAGLSTAYLLSRKGQRVLVLDDGPIGGGMTCRTTAHLSYWIDDHLAEIRRLHGQQGLRLAMRSHEAAIEAIESIVQQEGIDCDFQRVDGYLVLAPDESSDTLVKEMEAAHEAGFMDVGYASCAPMPGMDTAACLRFPRVGQFHPLKYLAGLARAIEAAGGRICCGTHVTDIEGGEPAKVTTAAGHTIDADAVVVATNAPINDRVQIHTKQAPYLSYVVAFEVPPGLLEPALLWDTGDPYHYVRLHRQDGVDYLIVGGEDHKTGQADDAPRRFEALEKWTRERYPLAGRVTHRWSGQVMETVDGLAFIGANPIGQKNVYVATGDSGMGMTHGTIAGLLLANLITGGEPEWSDLYDPSRVRIGAAGTYLKEAANMAWQYADWVKPSEGDSLADIANGTGVVMREGLHRIALYRDDAGELHRFSAKCPHLGCVVAWNSTEHTWDCPCHGSRFEALGNVLNGPAIVGLEPILDEPVEPRPPAPPTEPIAPPPPSI